MTAEEQPNAETDTRRRFSLIHGGRGPGERTSPTAIGDGVDDAGSGSGAVADESNGGAPSGRDGRHGGAPEERGEHEDDGEVGSEAIATGDGRGVEPDPPTRSGDTAGVGTVAAHHAVAHPGNEHAEARGRGDLEHDDVEARDAIVAKARAVLADADPMTYFRSLRSLVRDSHSSVLGPLDYDEDLSFHDPSEVVVPVAITNIETTLLYARAAYPDFDEVILSAFLDPARHDLLVALYDLLFVEERNVALVTNHGQIIDIALVVAALFLAMVDEGTEFGVLGERVTPEEMGDRCNTLVSRMVVTRQAFGIPALQVTQHAMRVFLSLPQTASRRRSKIDPTLARANNALMRFELEKQLARGGQLLAMAASGSQDLTIPQLMNKARAAWRSRRGDDPGEEPTLHLQPLYNGTVSLMRSCDYVLPVAVSLDSKCPAVVVGGLTRLREDGDCHRVMDWIALAHQKATGIPTIYHQPGDDLLTHVRSLINR